jgi:hypothetical protein
MRMGAEMRKRTRIVPGLVMTATFAAVSVVPACGGTTVSGDGGSDAKADIVNGVADGAFGVAAVAYCCFDAMGVADVGFVPDAPSDAPDDGG